MNQTMPQTPFYTKLKNRGLLTLSGPDTREFLQGLITNDMQKLTLRTQLYACLLTPQGKFLHDFFVIEHGENILIDCEGGERTLDLARRLSLYKLRKNIQIETTEANDVYAIFHKEHGLADPRHAGMGYRSFEKPDLQKQDFEEWDYQRIKLCIPDGSRDLIIEKSTMDEANMDRLNAIDYKKGCYIGQELTARMHYRGLGKKHLKTIAYPPLNEQESIPEIRSYCRDLAIALLRSDPN